MQYYDLGNPAHRVDFATATSRGLAPSGGLYMPEGLSNQPHHIYPEIKHLPLPQKAFHVAKFFAGNCLADETLSEICQEAFNFDVPLHYLNRHTAILELFHGPSLAFKDFGARFMSRVMWHIQQQHGGKLHVLVATSGDTGGAVAMGFYRLPGIKVTILFPRNRVSHYQRLQLTRLGHNVQALEVDGTFDDCQALVKSCFTDVDFKNKYGLTSANSINISRLIPQCVYYMEALASASDIDKVAVIVPSGNFGNLTAGLMAWRLGLPVVRFIAAVNANNVFTKYLATGQYIPAATQATLSNAMDVGNPSNFTRLVALFNHDITAIRSVIASYSISDADTLSTIESTFQRFGYLTEPHTAVALHAWQLHQTLHPHEAELGICLGTAHPAKFIHELPPHLQAHVPIPESLQKLELRPEYVKPIPNDIDMVKSAIKIFEAQSD